MNPNTTQEWLADVSTGGPSIANAASNEATRLAEVSTAGPAIDNAAKDAAKPASNLRQFVPVSWPGS